MRRNRVAFSLMLLVASTPAIRAAEFADGTGTSEDPYRIATAEQLISIGSDPNLLDRRFVMVNDIDLDPNLLPQYLFHDAVIGAKDTCFSGTFDGNGHRIRHLTIEGNGSSGQLGLFARICGGEVKHLTLEAVRITSRGSMAGGLCVSNKGMVFQCAVTGTVSVEDTAGGLVAWNYGTVEESCSNCTVSAKKSGGLIGGNKGWVRKCSARGQVLGIGTEDEATGGLVAINSHGLISRCYAICQIDNGGFLSGGLVGREDAPATVTLSYFRASAEEEGPDNGIGTPLGEAQMGQQKSFIGWEFWGADTDASLVQWLMSEEGYPQLAWLSLKSIPNVGGLTVEEAQGIIKEAGFRVGQIMYDYDHAVKPGRIITTHPYRGAPADTLVDMVLSLGPYTWSTNPGTGSPTNPYGICSAGQLDCLAYQPELWASHFKLVGDLIMTGRNYRRPLLGRSSRWENMFEGTFDGNGHIIESLVLETDPQEENGPEKLGLFGEIAPKGHVKDLGLRHVSIKGGYWAGSGGMLCGSNMGHIERCWATGTVQCRGDLGGLVGNNAGVIENCYAEGRVQDSPDAPKYVLYGGLIGRNTIGTIRTCYATCSVPPDKGAGLVASNMAGTVECCLWDVQTSEAKSSDGGGTGLTTREFMDVQVLQDHGWGANPNWIVNDGKDYPRLIWEGTSGTRLVPISPL